MRYEVTVRRRLRSSGEEATYTYHSSGDDLTTAYVVTQLLHDAREDEHTELLSITVTKLEEES